MRRLTRIAVAIAVVLGSYVAAASLSPAVASASVPPGCSETVGANYGSISVKCTTGHGSRFMIRAQACSTASCGYFNSSWVSYGSTAKVSVSSTAGFLPNTLIIYWATSTGPACAYSQANGTVAWCDIQASILDWAARGNVVYDESGATHDWNFYRDVQYRPDCSGMTAMAMHIGTNTLDTDALASSAYTQHIAWSSLESGDILDDLTGPHSHHHVVVFDHWNSDHTAGTRTDISRSGRSVESGTLTYSGTIRCTTRRPHRRPAPSPTTPQANTRRCATSTTRSQDSRDDKAAAKLQVRDNSRTTGLGLGTSQL